MPAATAVISETRTSAMKACSGSYPSLRRSKIRSSAALTSASGILCSGMILETWTIAPVMPRLTAWSRKTELSTCRAAGFRPNEMFDRPRMIWHCGISRLIASMPSSVHWPSLRSSSLPVATSRSRAKSRAAVSRSPAR